MHVRNWELSLPPCRMLICFWSGLPLPTPGRWKCWGNACVLKKAKKKVVFVQWLSPVQLFATPSMPSSSVLHYLPEVAQIHVHWVGDAIWPSHPPSPLLFLPSIFPSIRVFSNESALCIRWQSTGASTSASILPMNIQGWPPLGLINLLAVQKWTFVGKMMYLIFNTLSRFVTAFLPRSKHL